MSAHAPRGMNRDWTVLNLKWSGFNNIAYIFPFSQPVTSAMSHGFKCFRFIMTGLNIFWHFMQSREYVELSNNELGNFGKYCWFYFYLLWKCLLCHSNYMYVNIKVCHILIKSILWWKLSSFICYFIYSN